MCLLTPWLDSETLDFQSPDPILWSVEWMYKTSCFLSSVGQANYVFKLHFQAAFETTRNTSPSLTSYEAQHKYFPTWRGDFYSCTIRMPTSHSTCGTQDPSSPPAVWGRVSCLSLGCTLQARGSTSSWGVDFLVIGVLTCSPLHTWVPDRLSG